jgi:glycosyltransferase involved in cell wall biosynthesis
MGSLRERSHELSLLVPGDLTTRTGGYIYDRNIVDGLRRMGWKVDVSSLDSTFPYPTGSALSHANGILKNIPTGQIVVIDGLALAGLAALLRMETDRLRLVALIHHPLALETGLDETAARRLQESERDAFTLVRRVIVTSGWTARILAESDYGVVSNRIVVVEPGVDISRNVRTLFDPGNGALNLLCVATLTPRKGHAVLFEALNRLRDKNWLLRCVGSMQRDVVTAEALRVQVRRLGLGDRIEFLGEVDETALQQEYERADVFVLASYIEGYGMALAEAAAHGLPIVSTLAGAIPENAWSRASLLVPPGNIEALAEAINRLHDDMTLRQQLSMNALAARNDLPGWTVSSQRFAAALEDLP